MTDRHRIWISRAGSATRAVGVLIVVWVGMKLYLALHDRLGYGYLSPNPDLMSDLAEVHRNDSWFDQLTKGYYSFATGAFTPGPLYRWTLHLGQLLTGLFDIEPDKAAVSRWTAPSRWEGLPGHYLTDYGASRLGMAVVTIALIVAASILTWRWTRSAVAGAAILLAPLLCAAINLELNDGQRLDTNFTLPVPVIGPSLIPMSALLVALAIPAAAGGYKRGPAAALFTGGLLLGQHLLTLPLSLLAIVWAVVSAVRDTRSRGRWRWVRHLSWGWAPIALMAVRLLIDGPGSFLPNYQPTAVSFAEGWRGLGMRLHLPPAAALAVWIAVLSVGALLIVRAEGSRRLAMLGAWTVLAVALLQQLLFFPSWRHYYTTWVELVLVAYLLLFVVLLRPVRTGFAVGLAGIVLLLGGRLELQGQRITIDDQAIAQRDWDVLGVRDYAEGRRVDVGGDDGLAAIVLYMTEDVCLLGEPNLEEPFSWALCEGSQGADITFRRRPLDGVMSLDQIVFSTSREPSGELLPDGIVHVYTGQPQRPQS